MNRRVRLADYKSIHLLSTWDTRSTQPDHVTNTLSRDRQVRSIMRREVIGDNALRGIERQCEI